MPMSAVSLPLLRQLIAQVCERPLHEVAAHDRLVEDLRVDSLEMAGLLLDIENAYGITLDATAVQALQTVADLEAAVQVRR